MYAASDAFKAAVVRSHRLAILVEVLQNGAVIGDPITAVTGGSVVFDAKAQVRARLDLTMVGTSDLLPVVASDRLAPYGNELRVSRGLLHPGDTEPELVPLGVFRLNENDVEDSADGLTMRIAAPDRAARIIDARFEEPGQIAQGTNLADAILMLIAPIYPDVVTNFAVTSNPTPEIFWEEQGDRWQVAQDLATAGAMRLYFDRVGALTLAPDMTTDPAVTIAEGEDGVLLSSGRQWTREGAHNRWIVTGENTGEGAPVRGVATDDDPLSPTYYYGPFGPSPTFFVSQFVVTDDQAQGAAEAMKARERGTTQSIRFGSLVLPHLDPGDVAEITRERVGINAENHIIDSLTIPLTPDGAMAGATRVFQVAP